MDVGGSVEGRVVWSEYAGELVFLLEEDARELAVINSALAHATTWGELRSMLQQDPRAYQDFLDHLQEYIEEGDLVLGADGDEFDTAQVSALADGDWPGLPHQWMLEWMPEDMQER